MNVRNPLIGNLEHRILFSASPLVSLSDGLLSVEGTDQADSVVVREANGEVIVQAGVGDEAQRFSFNAGDVESLEFFGRDGDDRFVNNTSLDSLAYGNGGSDTLVGGFAQDELRGGDGDDFLNGRSGDDSLHGDHGNDRLVGAAGDDSLHGWFGNDELIAGAGNDYLSGYLGNDTLRGGAGDDLLRGHEGDDFLAGGQGNDELFGWLGNDRLNGGDGDDSLSGYHGDDQLVGGKGDDSLKGHEGDDKLYGGQGEDRLYGWHGEDELYGGQGDDWLSGSFDNDLVSGGEGDDEVHGGEGDDILRGGFGNDHLVGSSGDDELHGGHGDDTLCAGHGDDLLIGFEGNDTLNGQDGNDTITFGYSDDAVKVDLTTNSASHEVDGIEEVNSVESVRGSQSDDFFAFSNAEDGDEFIVHGLDGFDTLSLQQFSSEDVEVGDGELTVQLSESESFTVTYKSIERIVFADGERILNDIVTNLGGVEDGQLVSFRISGDHYDPNNVQDFGAGSPTYRITINGEVFVDADGNDSFAVQASRNFTLEGDIDGDGNVDQFHTRSREEFELVTVRVSNDTVIETVDIEFLQDAWDTNNDRDGDGVFFEDRNLIVDHVHIGGELNADGTYDGGTTIEAEDASQTTYQLTNGTVFESTEELLRSGTLSFSVANIGQPAAEVAADSPVIEEYVNQIFLNDSSGNLASYNTVTDEFVHIGNTSNVLTDIAITADGRLFGTSFNTLYEVDIATAELTTVAQYEGVGSINALTFLQDGTLVAAGFNTSELFEVNVDTAELTSLGEIGAASAGDLATHDDNLLLATRDGQLLAINLDLGDLSTETFADATTTTYGVASQGESLFVAENTSLFELNDAGGFDEVTNFSEHGISRVYGLTAYNEVVSQFVVSNT